MVTMGTGSMVYASSHINNVESGQVEVQGDGEIDLDIDLEKGETNSGTTYSSTSASHGTTTKPSTNDVGTGLNDGIAKNAKTGDIVNTKNMVILFVAAGAVLVIIGFKKRHMVKRD